LNPMISPCARLVPIAAGRGRYYCDSKSLQRFSRVQGLRQGPCVSRLDFHRLSHPMGRLFKDFETAAPLSPDGAPISRMTDCTFLVFDRLDEARRFCGTRVAQYPSMCCEIFGSEGKAKPPLLTIVHPSMAEKDELSLTWLRRRKVTAILCFLAAVPLFVWDSRAEWALILPSVIAFNLIFFGPAVAPLEYRSRIARPGARPSSRRSSPPGDGFALQRRGSSLMPNLPAPTLLRLVDSGRWQRPLGEDPYP